MTDTTDSCQELVRGLLWSGRIHMASFLLQSQKVWEGVGTPGLEGLQVLDLGWDYDLSHGRCFHHSVTESTEQQTPQMLLFLSPVLSDDIKSGEMRQFLHWIQRGHKGGAGMWWWCELIIISCLETWIIWNVKVHLQALCEGSGFSYIWVSMVQVDWAGRA